MKLNRGLNQQSWQEVKRFAQDDSFGCCLGAETQPAVSPYAARCVGQHNTSNRPTQHVVFLSPHWDKCRRRLPASIEFDVTT